VLGPLAVDASCQKLGIGAALMSHALKAARARGHGAVILIMLVFMIVRDVLARRRRLATQSSRA
jgi:GNAT superfamily N-acetyltransferase